MAKEIKYGTEARAALGAGVTVNGEAYEKGYYRDNTYSLATTDGKISLDKAGFTENENVVVISAEGYEDLEVVLDKNGKQVIEKASTMAIELPEMIVNTEPIEEEKPAVSEEISGKDSELSEKEISGEEIKEEDSKESTEDAEDVENSGDAEEAETENETETAESLSRTQRMQQKKMYWKRQQSCKKILRCGLKSLLHEKRKVLRKYVGCS